MKHTYAYLEQCMDAVQDIDPERLACTEVGNLLGKGTSVTSHASGTIPVGQDLVPLVTKITRSTRTLHPRLHKELAVAGLLTERVAALSEMLPRFLAGIAINGDVAAMPALITEDVTVGGSYVAEAVAPPSELKQRLRAAFEGEKGLMAVFDEDELCESVFFAVEDKMHILDLTPGPFSWFYERQSSDFRRHYAQVAEAYDAGRLSVAVSATTPFVVSMEAAQRAG